MDSFTFPIGENELMKSDDVARLTAGLTRRVYINLTNEGFEDEQALSLTDTFMSTLVSTMVLSILGGQE